MTLEQWAANGWVVAHEASRQELTDLVEAAQRDLDDASRDLSAAWRFAIAYTAALRLVTALIHHAGYRVRREAQHYRTIAALPLVLGTDARDLAQYLDHCRARRHEVTYESLSSVSDAEARELIETVRELQAVVRKRLEMAR